MRRRLSAVPTAFLPLVLLLSACSGDSGSGGESGEESTIRLVMAEMAVGIDPVNDDSSSYLRAYGAGEALMKVQADGTVEPELAESLEPTSSTVWTATLREAATFWSGAPVDADAVASSLERSRETPLGSGLLDGVTITANEERTVTFTTASASPYLAEALANYALTIHNTEAYPEGADETDPAIADMTGPYRITDFQTERSVSLERNEQWWGGDVGAAGVEVQVVPDPQSRAEIALSGQADLVQEVPGSRAEEIAAAGLQVASAPGANTVAVYLNPSSSSAPALADRRVRQALAWAVDREEVVELATNGLSVPCPSWLASSPAFPEAADQGYTVHDPELAATLLDEAGWTLDPDGRRVKDGQPLTVRMLTFGSEVPTAEVLQAQWGEVGVDVQVQTVESALINQAVGSGDWDSFTQAWTTFGDVPSRLATQIGPDGAANHGDYALPGAPELLEQAAGAGEQSERDAAALGLNQLIIDEVPLVPIHPRVTPTAVGEQVQGFVDHPLSYENLIQPAMTVG